MKEKILAALKLKFPDVKLSQKRLDAIAAKIEAKVADDETKIDAALDALNEIYPLADIAKDDHIRSTLEGKLKATQKKKETETSDAGTTDPATDPDDPDTPKWAKVLFEQNKKLSESLTALQGEKVAASIKERATKTLIDKGVRASWLRGRTFPEKEDALDDFITQTLEDYDADIQELNNEGLSVTRIPKSANGGKETGGKPEPKAASKEEVEKVLESIL